MDVQTHRRTYTHIHARTHIQIHTNLRMGLFLCEHTENVCLYNFFFNSNVCLDPQGKERIFTKIVVILDTFDVTCKSIFIPLT